MTYCVLDHVELTRASEAALAAARRAGATALSFFGSTLDPQTKSFAGDLVTVADRSAEAAASEVLIAMTPDVGLVGEEGTRRMGEPHWVLDALDGTLNFVRADPYWCTAVALVDDDGPLLSVVHQPVTGMLLSARRGGGLRDADGNALPVPVHRSLCEAVVCSYVEQDDLGSGVLGALVPRAAGLRARGSGSLDMAGVATGVSDVWVGRDMAAWDRHPGALLVLESGGATGICAGADGSEWFIAATSPALMEEVASVIDGVVVRS